MYIAAIKYGKISKEQILNHASIEVRFSDNEIKKGKMIGKTKDVIFILSGEKVEAIPITSSVKEFEKKIKLLITAKFHCSLELYQSW